MQSKWSANPFGGEVFKIFDPDYNEINLLEKRRLRMSQLCKYQTSRSIPQDF